MYSTVYSAGSCSDDRPSASHGVFTTAPSPRPTEGKRHVARQPASQPATRRDRSCARCVAALQWETRPAGADGKVRKGQGSVEGGGSIAAALLRAASSTYARPQEVWQEETSHPLRQRQASPRSGCPGHCRAEIRLGAASARRDFPRKRPQSRGGWRCF